MTPCRRRWLAGGAVPASLVVSSARAAAPWHDGFDAGAPPALRRWSVGEHGGAQGHVAVDDHAPGGAHALRLDSQSEPASGVWISVPAREQGPVAPAGTVMLRCRLAGQKAGRAFISVAFSPAGGETRVYLPRTISTGGRWHRQSDRWQDPDRGKVATNWSPNPTVSDVMPPVLAWFHRRATPADQSFCTISGLGYMNARICSSRLALEDRGKIRTACTAALGRYMPALDLHVPGLSIGSWSETAEDLKPLCARLGHGVPGLRGIRADSGRTAGTDATDVVESVDGLSVIHPLMRWIPRDGDARPTGQLDRKNASIDFTVRELLEHAPKARPAVMRGLILSLTTTPRLVRQVAERLPADTIVVTADELMPAMRRMAAATLP